MLKVELQVQPREITGRKVKDLRRSGFLPAVIYGHNFSSLNIQIPIKEFEKTYLKAGESTLVYLNLDKENYPTIIHDVVRHPINESFQHADFYKVRLDERIHAKIPLHFVGESPAVKGLGGILVKNITELEVIGFPQDLPHGIEVNISALAQFRDQILVKDLSFTEKLEIKAKPEEIIALIQEPISEEELKAQLETPTSIAPEDVEVIKKEKPEEEATEDTPKTEAVAPVKK